MSIILGPNNTYKIKFQHGNLMITTPPQTYTVLSNNDIKVDVEYGSYIAYVAMENFKYRYEHLDEFAKQIQDNIKLKLNMPEETNQTSS